MNIQTDDPRDVAIQAFIAGAEFAEIQLGGSVPLGEVKEAAQEWLESL